jgi:hypothetical protein
VRRNRWRCGTTFEKLQSCPLTCTNSIKNQEPAAGSKEGLGGLMIRFFICVGSVTGSHGAIQASIQERDQTTSQAMTRQSPGLSIGRTAATQTSIKSTAKHQQEK